MGDEWQALLRKRIEATSQQAVADELGYSRTAVSLALAGKYSGRTDRIAQRVIAIYSAGHVFCPHTEKAIERERCQSLATAECPTATAAAIRQWRACQVCPNRPKLKEKSNG